MLLAGHEPQFSQLAAYLLAAPELVIDFKKGALWPLRWSNSGFAREAPCVGCWPLSGPPRQSEQFVPSTRGLS